MSSPASPHLGYTSKEPISKYSPFTGCWGWEGGQNMGISFRGTQFTENSGNPQEQGKTR